MRLISSPISFKANINFVSYDRFYKESDYWAQVKAEPDSFISHKNWNRSTVGDEGLTHGIACCVAGGVTNKLLKKVAIFHYLPIPSLFLREHKDDLKAHIDSIKSPACDQEGLIIGGDEPGTKTNKNGATLVEEIKTLFNNFSVFFGQKSGGTEIYYTPETDTWFVAHSGNGGDDSDNVLSAEDLVETFGEIYVAPHDTVLINDVEVDKEKLRALAKRK